MFSLIIGAGLVTAAVLGWKWLVCVREFDYHQEMLQVLSKKNCYCPKKAIKSKVEGIIKVNDMNWGFIKYKPIPMYIKLCDDTLSIYSLCFLSSKLDNICEQLMNYRHIIPESDKSIKIYRITGEGNKLKWKCHYEKPGRPLSTVFLDNDLKNRVINDAEDFLVSEDWYKTRNIPYRRGYLLYGQTGCGKSSLVTAICSELNLSIYWIQLNKSNPYLNDRNLINAFNSVPKGQVILIENIDRACDSSCITLPGILNALDGPIAHTDHLVFFTANNLGSLDKSLIRPGRIDTAIHIPLANSDQIRKMFMHIYSDLVDTNLVDKYVSQIPENMYQMCIIQSHLIKCKDSPELAVDTIKPYLNAIN